jgi:uncharacterized protein YukE
MGEILYDPATMNTLHDDLQGAGQKLQQEQAELEQNAAQFRQALLGDNAQGGFDAAHKAWDDEFSNQVHVLAQLTASVDSALNNALAADSAVGDGFHVM